MCGTWQKRAANAAADLLHESNRQRMRAVALLSESMAAQMEPAGRSAAPSNAERYVDPVLLHRRQPAADAACCLAPAGESTAAQTKPARAGVRCKASAELHLTANAGRCELNSWARMLAVALLNESIAAQMEPAGRSAALGNADRYVAGCRFRVAA